ncbi:MAG: serine/threonine protein phosphatase [Chitinophagaceae bacterium]|nr:serine/threonine protein phosphatase [Chitinophagaceae bacterium]
MAETYIIGDVHGCCKTLRHLISEKINLKKSDRLYLVGDLIDRGPDSKGVIDYIIELENEGYQIFTVRGNHEQMLLDSLEDDYEKEVWLENGGMETLSSYGVQMGSEIDPSHLRFILNTEYYYTGKNFIITHAGLNFKIEEPMTDLTAMLWIRKFNPDIKYLGKRILVHGHTPIPLKDVLSQEIKGAVNIDAGCVFPHKGFGHLVALHLNKGVFIVAENID